VQERALPPLKDQVELALSFHGADACVMGAAALVLDNVVNNPVAYRSDTQFQSLPQSLGTVDATALT
jgi:hypothetical protein